MKTDKLYVKRYAEEDENYWKNHLAKLSESSLSIVAYCKEYNVNRGRFGYWKRRLHQTNQSTTNAPQHHLKTNKLVPITIKTPLPVNSKELYSLHFKNGCILKIHQESAIPLILTAII